MAAYAEGTLGPPTRAELERHLDACESCRQLVSELARASRPPDELVPGEGERDVVPVPSVELLRGDALGRFRVQGELGRGAMGVVYRALDPRLHREVALKLVRPGPSTAASVAAAASAALVREARAQALVSHPNVVPVFEVGSHQAQVYVAMELVAGVTLRQWLQTPRTRERLLEVFLDVARGVAAAHRRGLVHCDLKPDNVLVGDDGRARVTDFGLARWGVSGAGAERGGVVGTPRYMAPEVRDGQPPDAWSDQFSFGVALAEALATHRRSARLEALVARCRAQAPQGRWPSMDAVVVELERCAQAPSRRRTALAVAALGLGLLAATSAFVLRGPPVCSGARAALGASWVPARRAQLQEAFSKLDAPFSATLSQTVQKVLDAYAEEWVAMHVDACEATRVRREQSEAVLERRMACLASLARRLEQVTATLAEGRPPVLERAAGLLDVLPRVSNCSQAALTPTNAGGPAGAAGTRPALVSVEASAVAATLELRLAKAHARRAAGETSAVAVELEAIAQEAAQHHLPGLRAQALEVLAGALLNLGELEKGDAAVRDGLLDAERAGDDRVRARLGLRQLGLRRMQGRVPEAEQAHASTLAVLTRLGDDRPLLAAAENALSDLLRGTGRFEASVSHARSALAALANESSLLAQVRLGAWMNLSLSLYGLGRYDEALAAGEEGLRWAEAALGVEHPDVAYLLQSTAYAAAKGGQLERAVALTRRALAIAERADGPDTLRTAHARAGLAAMLLDAEEAGEALALLQKVEGTFRRGVPAGDLTWVYFWGNRARGHLLRGELDEAVRCGARARELLRGVEPSGDALALRASADGLEGDVWLARGRARQAEAAFRAGLALDADGTALAGAPGVRGQLLTGLSEALFSQRLPREAEARAREAVALLEHGLPQERARAELALGRALEGTSPEEAGRQVRAARERLGPGGAGRKLAREIDAWLVAHRATAKR